MAEVTGMDDIDVTVSGLTRSEPFCDQVLACARKGSAEQQTLTRLQRMGDDIHFELIKLGFCG